MNVLLIIFIGIIGLVFGSFMNVLIMRVPKNISIVKPSSFCPQCMENISWKDNIPVISYILLKGRCRHCKKSIPIMYPLTEILSSLLFVVIYLKFGLSLMFFKYVIFIFLVLVVSLTDIYTSTGDFETGMIPTVYIALGILAGLIFAFFEGYTAYYLAGIAAGYLVLFFPAYFYSLIRHKEGMGEGDFMFFAMAGAFTGLGSIPAILTFAAFFGIVAGIVVVTVTKDRNYPIPFAPMLGVSAIIYVFFEELLNSYNWSSFIIN
ncbi:prepilin peptidase [Mucispirillum schaedleri]|jgi:leader peptidase (prepilin peptidase)/N-methyltransferase|uniref:Type 4 prepilin-like proteins leader peptide-processing enzyme n=1 Tax=Mucispirillum schaedleri ASF457 TaxID=1379858 RepID=V2QCU5_9BACT|nr:A24 family peptidase [Mucispirillum schaedleri]MCX4360977.1 prepilin peptidase [Mucispirillum schaedleri]USF24881.1 Type 4 prepilin-like proteins leader peptide-processing enzyme [Mucispirillum schaedleri ASF457]SIW07611.1 conserved membrane hypothetical protein [Mucispirillum schaedleri ASF457]